MSARMKKRFSLLHLVNNITLLKKRAEIARVPEESTD